MRKKLSILDILGYIVLAATIGFNLYLYFPETQILADPNDNIFQYSLVNRTNWVWENYGCPFSLKCLPNLVDHNVPNWAEGYPLPFYYSHIPQIIIVASYNLFINPVINPLITNYPFDFAQGKQLPITLYQYYNWTKYLLLSFFPLSVFLALRIVGFSPIIASLGSFFSSHFSTDGLYGIDPPSFLWRGYGLTSQLYAIFFLPLGLAFVYRALRQVEIKWETRLTCLFAVLFLTLTTAGHLGIGIIGLISTIPFLFLDLNKRNIVNRAKILFIVYCFVFIALSYWIIPILLNNQYHIISFWDPIWKFNSYGWYEVIKQFLAGEIFDWQRAPIITFLTLIGFFALLINKKLFSFSLLFALWTLFYFGRTTWGGLIDLIAGMKDFHQHRFIVGVHIAALFLIPAGINWVIETIWKLIKYQKEIKAKPRVTILETALMVIRSVLPRIGNYGEEKRDHSGLGESEKFVTEDLPTTPKNIFYFLSLLPLLILAYFTAKQTVNYNSLNSRWIYEANTAYKHDEKHFIDLTNYLNSAPNARIYAGRPGNWGKEFRLGSTQMYMALGVNGLDMSQFLPETWSMLSENEQNFDERIAEDYDLLNIRYVVTDKNHDFNEKVQSVRKFGPFELYEIPTSGWFDVVTSPMFVKSDKTNFINIVHLWHRSYPRRWKMHPLISVEKKPNIPDGMQKIIGMKDEVSYLESVNDTPIKNIFSDFPFVFPEATVSAYLKADGDQTTPGVAFGLPWGEGIRTNDLKAIISNEKLDKQTYSATIDVPQNCSQCMIMFKMSYHPNWQARLDGQSVEKFAVFPYYLAVSATPGTHTVEFSYEPNGLKVVLLFLEMVIGILFIFRMKMRKLLNLTFST